MERRAWLHRQLDFLSQSERDAVDCRVFLGMPFRVVAEELECTEGAARLRVHRGLNRLREHLAEDPFPNREEPG